MTQTKMNYTGQKLDSTGLLFYNARYYDPIMGRFTSPDSIVPGASSGVGGAGGTVGAEQNTKLTVDFHETGFLSGVNSENALTLQKGFWFQLSNEDRGKAKEPWGPGNPQALNRYAYVLNNPIRYTDPTGHVVPLVIGGVVITGAMLVVLAGLGISAFMLAVYLVNEDFRTGVGSAINAGINDMNAFASDLASAIKRNMTVEASRQHEQDLIKGLVDKYGLSPEQRRTVHDLIHGKGYSDEEIESEAAEVAARDSASRDRREQQRRRREKRNY